MNVIAHVKQGKISDLTALNRRSIIVFFGIIALMVAIPIFLTIRPTLDDIKNLNEWTKNDGKGRNPRLRELIDLQDAISAKNKSLKANETKLTRALELQNTQAEIAKKRSEMLQQVILGSNHALKTVSEVEKSTEIVNDTDGDLLLGIPDHPIFSGEEFCQVVRKGHQFDAKLATSSSQPSIHTKALYEVELCAKDGQIRTVCAIDNGGGSVAYLVQDVTTYRTLMARKVQSEKIQLIGEFTSSVAHDFNNILAIILAYLEASAEEADATQRNDSIHQAMKAVERGAGLVQSILSFSKHEVNSSPINVDIAQQVQRAIAFVKVKLGKDVHIKFTCSTHKIIRVDPLQFDNALLNLIMNACDAMNNNGQIDIRIEEVLPEDYLKAFGQNLPKKLTSEYVAIKIRDCGSGVPKHIEDRIFDPYFSTKTKNRGTGLGLSTSQRSMESMGGALILSQNSSTGAEFAILLPVSKGEKNYSPLLSIPSETIPLHSKVLVVDDEIALANAICAALRAKKLQCVCAKNLKEAKQSIDELEMLDAVITDFWLPDGTGAHVFKNVRQKFPNAPVALISGNIEEACKNFDSDIAFDSMLAKPFTMSQILELVMQFLQKNNADSPSHNL